MKLIVRFPSPFSSCGQVTFETPVGDRGAIVLDDVYLWTTNNDAVASIMDGDNEVSESDGALICSSCQVIQRASQ